MVGTLPTLRQSDVGEAALSENPRYRLLNDQVFAARGEDLHIEVDGVDRLRTYADTITPEAACTSTQFHLQVAPEEFADYWNAAQAIAGVQVALAANSPFLLGKELWHESRIPLLEQATHTRPQEIKAQGVRPRVWFGSAGSTASSTSSRRTSATSRRCCPCATSRTPPRPSTAATSRNWAS
ncbi:hypothetical protein STENM327S_06089 [Streptomyces tendae]